VHVRDEPQAPGVSPGSAAVSLSPEQVEHCPGHDWQRWELRLQQARARPVARRARGNLKSVCSLALSVRMQLSGKNKKSNKNPATSKKRRKEKFDKTGSRRRDRVMGWNERVLAKASLVIQ
jgi:hypothetical protein